MNTRAHTFGLATLYGSIFLLATNGLFAKSIPLDAMAMTQLRSVVASCVLIGFMAVQRSPLLLGSFKETIGVYLLGVVLGLHWITYFHAMQVSTVAIGMLALFSYPVITVIIEPLLLRRRPHFSDVLAGALVFFGIFTMVFDDILGGEFSSGTVVGAAWGFVSAILFALRNTVQKHYFAGTNSVTLMAHQTLAIACMLLPFLLMNPLSVRQVSGMSGETLVLVLALGCFSTATAHTLLSMSLKRLAAKSVALISCMTPLVGAALAWGFLDETPTLSVYVGGAIIMSVALFETLKKHITHDKK